MRQIEAASSGELPLFVFEPAGYKTVCRLFTKYSLF